MFQRRAGASPPIGILTHICSLRNLAVQRHVAVRETALARG